LKLLCESHVLKRTRDQNEVYYRVTIDEDRRGLVQKVLVNLPARDPVTARDQERLTAILDSRQAQARELLARMGVRPLSPPEIREVGTAVETLLKTHLSGNEADTSLGDLLDIGTGTGSMLRLLARQARRTVAIDQSREMRLVARATVLSQGLSNCTVQKGDMYDLGFPEKHFDIATMDRVVGTADNPDNAIREAGRVIKDGGHLLLVETSGLPADETRLIEYIENAGLSLLELQQTGKGTAVVAFATRVPPPQSNAA
jgi:ArsR family transcriptional regulator